jgi:hypothetical protein
MNIHTVRDNLKNTIAGKEKLLEAHRKVLCLGTMAEDAALYATVSFLAVNIDELKRILQDVEVCCEKATQDSWAQNPDRSGGQFTQEEIDRANEWR